MQVEIKCVLDGIVGPIIDRWSKRGKDMNLGQQLYRFTAHAAQSLKNSTFGGGERSSLKIYIDKIVDESFRETVARNRTTEKLERIQKELSVSLSVAMRARLRRISDELNRIRMNNEIQISDGDFQFGAGAICDEILVSDIGETITLIVAGAYFAVCLMVIDASLTGGLITGTITAASGFFYGLKRFKKPINELKASAKVANDGESALAKKMRTKLETKHDEILRMTVGERLEKLERDLMKYYDSEVDGLISKLAAEISQAKSDTDLKRDERERLKHEHKQVQQVLGSLRQRMDTLLPEMS